MRTSYLALAVVAIASGAAHARGEEPKVGAPAPPISAGALFQAPKGAKVDLASLRGNVVVMDFWATWCAPCIGSMPEFNALAETFRGQPVRFLSISDERADKVEKFLKKGLLKTWVVADPSGATHKAYDISLIPRAAIVDAQGKLVAMMDPREITPEMLNRVLKGESLAGPAPAEGPKEPVTPKAPIKAGEPMYVFDIRPTDRPNNRARMGLKLGVVEIDSMSFDAILPNVLGVSPTRIVTEGKLPPGTYRLQVALPPSLHQETSAFVSRRLEECFGITIRTEKRRMRVSVLTAPKGAGAEMTKLSEYRGHSTGPGMFGSKGANLNSLSGFLETSLKHPVLNETQLEGPYEFNLLFKDGDPADLRRALTELGLVLTEEERDVEMYVVSAPKSPVPSEATKGSEALKK